MAPNEPLIDKQIIIDLLFGDEEYVSEFATASISSFGEFKQHFAESVLNRDIKELRKAGHKIKPGALMMKQDTIIDMYEESKNLLEDEVPDSELQEIVDKMNNYCDRLLAELKEMAD